MGGQTGQGGGIVLPDGSAAGGSPGNDGGGVEAPSCGLENFKLERVPPEILLVLDRSSSMLRRPEGAPMGSMATLWTDTLAALDDVLMNTQAKVHWGLKMFPTPTGCMVAGGPEVNVAVNNYSPVLMTARMTGTNTLGMGMMGGTPTDLAMNAATTYLTGLNATSKNPKYILLATDGEPTCTGGMSGGDSVTAAVNAIKAALAAGFKTYVIGIAIDGSLTVLNQMAEAGGVPRNDPMFKFYPAGNRADLVTALNVITGEVSNCIFPLSKTPPVKDNVKVTVDGMRVPDAMTNMTDNWSYTDAEAKAIRLNGSWCEKVKTGTAQVDIVFGCPDVPIP